MTITKALATSAAVALFGSAAQAISVTATFEGSVTDETGFTGYAGEDVVVTITGDTDAPQIPEVSLLATEVGSVIDGDVAAYFLTELAFAVPGQGLDLASADALIEVYDNITAPGAPGTFDAILARGQIAGPGGGVSGDILFASILPDDTFSGTGLAQATVSGLLGTTADLQGAELSILNDLSEDCGEVDGPCTLASDLTLTGFSEGGSNAGLDTKDMAPVPLPASALLLLAGLGGLAAARRRG